jgi:hypothetical protein
MKLLYEIYTKLCYHLILFIFFNFNIKYLYKILLIIKWNVNGAARLTHKFNESISNQHF